ncbi:hypothetical protein GOBAR_AA26864 [Gossypium barbadense]|uniref:Uncharacterized protein n=1 Tax=Gossypium barbadense TaxID=3634 RepID=A0A2P5WRX3_GOSBA|nr:hypothetical protein GOBAR_AA26864 [Gossypium barbadense]
MVTNLIEAVNGVLKRTHHLSISVVFSATFYKLATLIPRIGLKQAKQINMRHVYCEEVKKAMDVNAWSVRLGPTELISEMGGATVGGSRFFSTHVHMTLQLVHGPMSIVTNISMSALHWRLGWSQWSTRSSILSSTEFASSSSIDESRDILEQLKKPYVPMFFPRGVEYWGVKLNISNIIDYLDY